MNAVATPLLHADPVFPQRDLLLDPAFVIERVVPNIGQMDHCERMRVTYRAGESLRVLYKLEGGGKSYMLAARAFPANANPVNENSGSGKIAPAFRDDAHNTLYWQFPHDRKIANLPQLMNVPQSLSDLLDSRWQQSKLMAYAPEKCATVQCQDEDHNALAYAKCYAGHDGLDCCRIYSELADATAADPQFSVPRVIAYSDSLHMLLLEAIEGRRIADLQGEELERGLGYLGRALAAFHSIPASKSLPKFTRLDHEQLQQAAAAISLVRPDVAALAQQLCSSLCSDGDSASGEKVRVHGDVHPKNGILRGDRVVLIDLDQSGVASAAADLGSFLAALRYEVITGTLSSHQENRMADAFLSGYAALRNLPRPAELQWHKAAALLAERALRAVSRVRTEGLENLRELLLETMEMRAEVHAW